MYFLTLKTFDLFANDSVFIKVSIKISMNNSNESEEWSINLKKNYMRKAEGRFYLSFDGLPGI